MNSGLFTAAVVCPICEKEFTVLKVRSTAYNLDHSDEDFCMHYTDLNPLLYEPWICTHCGYAEFGVYFDKLSSSERSKLEKLCLMKFVEEPAKNPFELTAYHKQVYAFLETLNSEGVRDNASGIEAFKILLNSQEIRNSPYSSKAKVATRIGWIYRFMKDPKELEYLEMAADFYAKAYESESLDDGKFDSATCAYMAGEMNRRVGKSKEAIEWFRNAMTASKTSENPKIVDKIRNQMDEAKRMG